MWYGNINSALKMPITEKPAIVDVRDEAPGERFFLVGDRVQSKIHYVKYPRIVRQHPEFGFLLLPANSYQYRKILSNYHECLHDMWLDCHSGELRFYEDFALEDDADMTEKSSIYVLHKPDLKVLCTSVYDVPCSANIFVFTKINDEWLVDPSKDTPEIVKEYELYRHLIK